MRPFHLLIQPTIDSLRVDCQWFGQSALRPAGALNRALLSTLQDNAPHCASSRFAAPRSSVIRLG